MAHAVEDEPILHMGVAVSHGKLAVWIFLGGLAARTAIAMKAREDE